MSSETQESPLLSTSPKPRRGLGGAVVLALVIVVASVGAYQAWVERTWPPQILHPSAHHYHVLAAPAEMLLPQVEGPTLTAINEVGEVLIYSGARSVLWIPPGVDTMNAQLVDFNTVFDISQDKGRIVASALNPYGQVAGLVEWPDVSPRRSALFLWTPDHPNGHAGVITYLTDPTGQASSILLQINAFGQVTFARGNELVLWTPETSHGPEGSTHTIQQVAIADELNLRGLNAYGQIAGGAHGRTFLWTPEHPQATTGIFMWFDEEIDSVDALNDVGQVLGHDADEQAALLWTPTQAHGSSGHITRIAKPSNSSGVRFYALSGRGALAGLAYDASHALGNGPLNDALVWLPDAPNSSTGQVRTLGALGWNEDGITREVNAAGTALGDSCFLERQGFDGGCGQNRSFVWNPRDGMQDLQTLLDPGSGYTSTRAWALNDRGQILAVGASSSETYRLLLLTPH